MSVSALGPHQQLVVLVLDGERYALEVRVVERVLPMVAVAPLPKGPDVVLGVINLHGRVLPVVDIRRRFRRPARDYDLTAHVVVARTAQRVLAFPVDETLGVREVTTASITPARALLPGIEHVAGVVTLDDGLLFIHDLDAFLSLDEEHRLREALREVDP